MSIREFMNNNPAVATIGVVVVLVIALGILIFVMSSGPGIGDEPPAAQATFFDLGTGKIVLANEYELPPFDTGSGKQSDGSYNGVRMMVWTCGKCLPLKELVGMTPEQVSKAGDGKMFVAYLEKYTKKGRDALIKAKDMKIPGTDTPIPEPDVSSQVLIRTVNGKWVVKMSDKGRKVTETTLENVCPGNSNPRPCNRE